MQPTLCQGPKYRAEICPAAGQYQREVSDQGPARPQQLQQRLLAVEYRQEIMLKNDMPSH